VSHRARKPTWNIRYLVWLGLIALLTWGLWTIPLQPIWQAIRGLSLLAITTLILVNLGLFLLFSIRWWLILRAQGYRLPYLSLVGYRLAGFSLAYFTPGPQFGGEPLQVYLSRSRHSLPDGVAIAAVALDKLLELMVNFTFLIMGIAITIQSGLLGDLAIDQVLGLAVALLVLPGGYLLALWAGWQPLTILSQRLPGWAHRSIPHIIIEAEAQVTSFCRQHPGAILLAVLLSLVVWAGMILEYWLMLHFLGLELSLAQTVSALTAARLAFLAPTPGGLGALEASQIFALQVLGFSPALGLSVTFLIRARDLIIGGLGMWWLGILTRGKSSIPIPVEVRN
jgi:glycosyltransferase 2 family protein